MFVFKMILRASIVSSEDERKSESRSLQTWSWQTGNILYLQYGKTAVNIPGHLGHASTRYRTVSNTNCFETVDYEARQLSTMSKTYNSRLKPNISQKWQTIRSRLTHGPRHAEQTFLRSPVYIWQWSSPETIQQVPTKTDDHTRKLGLSSKAKGSNKIVLVVGVDGLWIH